MLGLLVGLLQWIVGGSVRMLEMEVPGQVMMGERAVLECRWGRGEEQRQRRRNGSSMGEGEEEKVTNSTRRAGAGGEEQEHLGRSSREGEARTAGKRSFEGGALYRSKVSWKENQEHGA